MKITTQQRQQLFAFWWMHMRMWVSEWVCGVYCKYKNNEKKMLISLLLFIIHIWKWNKEREKKKKLKMLIQNQKLCLKNLHAFEKKKNSYANAQQLLLNNNKQLIINLFKYILPFSVLLAIIMSYDN